VRQGENNLENNYTLSLSQSLSHWEPPLESMGPPLESVGATSKIHEGHL